MRRGVRVSTGAMLLAIVGPSLMVTVFARPAEASCVGSAPAPFEKARPGQTLRLSGSFQLACRDTGGGPPFPKATAPRVLPVTLSTLPDYRHSKPIGQVRTVRVVRPRSATPMAEFRGTVRLPMDLAAGRYSVLVYGSWGKRLLISGSPVGPTALPTTGVDLIALSMIAGVAVFGGAAGVAIGMRRAATDSPLV